MLGVPPWGNEDHNWTPPCMASWINQMRKKQRADFGHLQQVREAQTTPPGLDAWEKSREMDLTNITLYPRDSV